MMWSIEYNGIHKTLADWRIHKLSRTRHNQAKDIVRFTQELKTANRAPSFEAEQSLKILREGKPWFYGLITRMPVIQTGRHALHSYEVCGPWWYLENLVFEQTWQANAQVGPDGLPKTQSIHTTRVILGQNERGQPIHTGEQIKRVLEFAMLKGAPFKIGTIDPEVHFPYDETKDISCAEVIHRLLRWSPDAALWFDYTTSPLPTLHITNRSSQGILRIDLQKHPVAALSASPRHDLQINAVTLKYEKTHEAAGETWTSIEVDRYPTHINTDAFKHLVLTIGLIGMQSAHSTQTLETERIEPETAVWWQARIPALQGLSMESIVVESVSRTSDLPNEIISGSVAKWTGKKAALDTITALISYTSSTESVSKRPVTVKLHATNAQSQTYEYTQSYTPEEPAPKGLAQSLYEALSPLQYEGEITLEALHPITHKELLGKRLQIIGLEAAFGHIEGAVQVVTEDLKTGKTHIRFGPPSHLGPNDLIELTRLNRKRGASLNAPRRISGKAAFGKGLEHATHGRFESTQWGKQTYNKLVLENPNNQNARIKLDANQLPTDTELQLREEFVCDNGKLKKRLVLASNPLDYNE